MTGSFETLDTPQKWQKRSEELSLSENVSQEPTDPMSQFFAFSRLMIDRGSSVQLKIQDELQEGDNDE